MSLHRLPWARVGLARYPSSSLDRRPADSGAALRGPELLNFTDGQWSSATGVTQDGNGVHFLNANPITVSHDIVTEDNATYELIYTFVFASGGMHIQLYGATTAHLGTTITRSSSGTFTEQVTTNGAGSLALKVRIGSTNGAAGSNSFDVTALSIKKVLG